MSQSGGNGSCKRNERVAFIIRKFFCRRDTVLAVSERQIQLAILVAEG